MAGGTSLVTFAVAALASVFMAWSIGAGSSGSTPFAPAVGANAISVLRAGFVVGLLGFAGAVLQGANVTEAVGTGLVVFPDGGGLSAIAATVALLTAAALVALGVFAGYPIATAFTVTGAVVGTGLAMGGAPAWAKYAEIVTMWALVPFFGGGTAYAIAKALRSDRVRERTAVPVLAGTIGILLANVNFVLLGPPGEGASIAATLAAGLPGGTRTVVAVSLALGLAVAGLVAWDLARDEVGGQRRFLLSLGGLVAFSAGGSQVGLALGPLLPLIDPSPLPVAIPLVALLAGGGLGLLVGSWTGAPRMIKALAQDYSSLGPRRSIAALAPAFAIAQTAVFFGIPVSFNEIVVSSIVGSGYAAGGAGVSKEKMAKTVLAWIGSLVVAGAVGYAAFSLIDVVT